MGKTHWSQCLAISTRRDPVWRNPEQALYRELREEVGLLPEHVQIIAQTKGWLRYRFATSVHSVRFRSGMYWTKAKVVLLKLTASPHHIQLNLSDPPEFDQWQWVSYWYPLGQVVNFKVMFTEAMMELCLQLPQR